MNDQELEQLAQRLGNRAAERLDVEATARAVVDRLRQAPEREPVRWIKPEWLQIAAVLALLLGAGIVLQPAHGPAGESASYALADLSDLTAAELTQILGNLERTLEGDGTEDQSLDLEDLTPAQLQALLRSLET